MEDLLKLSNCELSLLKEMSTVVNTGEKNYYFLPYWFEETDVTGQFIFHSLNGKLPVDLITALNHHRLTFK